MSNEVKGYGARRAIKAEKSKYLPVSNKLKLGLFPKAEIRDIPPDIISSFFFASSVR